MPDVLAPSCRPTKAGQELPHVGDSIPLSGKLTNPSLESAGNAPGSVQQVLNLHSSHSVQKYLQL